MRVLKQEINIIKNNIRKKRNEIAHEYIANEEYIINIYKYLFDSVDKIEVYTKKYID